jgi:molybdopterin-guanine dinucleotide biosynthesis protein A
MRPRRARRSGVVHLVRLAGDTSADAVVPVVDGRLQPLLAAYRAACTPRLEAAFLGGIRSMHDALAGLEVSEVELPPALAAATADVDTPEDLAQARGHSGAGEAIS